MKISYKGDYALKAMLDLALHYNVELVTSHNLAKRIDAPVKFLEQVLLELRRGGFVLSKRGKIGGYLLSKTPDKITVGEVVRYIDGPIEPISCVKTGYSGCKDLKNCVFRHLWNEVSKATSKIIDNVTLGDLAKEINSGKKVLVYAI